jgi:hypothetical protein
MAYLRGTVLEYGVANLPDFQDEEVGRLAKGQNTGLRHAKILKWAAHVLHDQRMAMNKARKAAGVPKGEHVEFSTRIVGHAV